MAGRRLSNNQKLTLGLSAAGVAIGAGSFFFGVVMQLSAAASNDMQNAILKLEETAEQSSRQGDALIDQNALILEQLWQQEAQTRALAAQAETSEGQLGQNALSARQIARQAGYLGQREAYVDYTNGHGAFLATIWRVRNRIHFDIEERSIVNGLARADLEVLRQDVEPIIGAMKMYSATVQGATPWWPTSIRQGILNVEFHAMTIANCYHAGSIRALTDVEAANIRSELNKHCRDLGTQLDQLNEDSENLYGEMARHLYGSANQLGAGPIE